MVSVSTKIDNPRPPLGVKSFVNQRVIPPAIDAAGAIESAVYELREQVRARPAASLLAAAALGFLVGASLFARTRRSAP